MPERKFKHRGNRVACDEVQGEDSYVIFDRMTTGEAIEVTERARKDRDTGRADRAAIRVMAEHIIEWNWVDDAGEPLPQPKENPKVIEELTDSEATFLLRIFSEPTPTEAELKN